MDDRSDPIIEINPTGITITTMPDGTEIFENPKARIRIEIQPLDGTDEYLAIMTFMPDPRDATGDSRSFPAGEAAKVIEAAYKGRKDRLLQIIKLKGYSGFPDGLIGAIRRHSSAAGRSAVIVESNSEALAVFVDIANKVFMKGMVHSVRTPAQAYAKALDIKPGMSEESKMRLAHSLGVAAEK